MTANFPLHPSSTPTNTMPDVNPPLPLQVRGHVARAKKLQAEAVADTLANIWLGVGRGLRATANWLARQRRQSDTRLALMACSDRTLADIGIPREQIHLAARGVDVSDPIAVSQAGWRTRLATIFERLSGRSAEQRRVYHELMDYNDRELEEIGVRRADIPTIARAA